MNRVLSLIAIISIFACENTGPKESVSTEPSYKTVGVIEPTSPAFSKYVGPDAKLEVLSEGHDWTEGPLWVDSEKMLLFSDIPKNSVFKWSPSLGKSSLYLKPAGYTGTSRREGEPGSNGLTLDHDGHLVLCQHGDRRIVRLVGDLRDPKPTYEVVVDNYGGKKLNSPNDAVYNDAGDLFFTDPPYGLEGNIDDPLKEISFQGVYRVRSGSSTAELLIDNLSRPNGIAFSPDGKILYVANSDPENAVWMAYDYDGMKLTNGRVFYDATPLVGTEDGLPDGLKVHSSGALFATGPGGVWVFNAEGEVLGKIKTGEATSNCAFDSDEKQLFITADMYVLRLPMM